MRPIRLAVDISSGDYGSRVLVRGVLEARRRCPYSLTAYLCGDKDTIEKELKIAGSGCGPESGFIIEHCSQTVEPHLAPSRVWKTRQQSPIVRCISLQKDGVVDASLSAGDTGTLMGAAIFLLGRIEGVARPALAALLPTVSKRPALLLDAGANLECRTEHLAAFGQMGFSYYRRFFGIECPRVAMLSIGHEPSKGTRTVREAGMKLARECAGYSGFIEGGRVLSGDADVIVCDGFTGNVLLKACESFHALADAVLAGNRKLADVLREKLSILNPDNYGAVPLLGIRGVVFKAHGSSSATAFAYALIAAVTAVHRGLPVMHNV